MKGKLFLDDNGRLKHSHKYYTQIQCQLAITERRMCDFIVWSPKDFELERITMENPFQEELQRKLTNIFVEHVIPEIMTQEMKSYRIGNR